MDDLHRRMAQRIRDLSELRNISLTHLPDRAGVSKAHFFDVMAGRKSPTLHWLSKVAEALDVEVSRLIAKDEPAP